MITRTRIDLSASVPGTAVALLLALGSSACLDNKLADPVGGQSVFIAQRPDFENYSDWEHFEHDAEADDEHGTLGGKTVVYLNEKPKDDATAFPVGTVIVRTIETTASPNVTIHAMVKRGGGFNPKGALGWEFFELALAKKDGQPFWIWRGEKPPSGEMYQLLLSQANVDKKDEEVDCNGCHAGDDAKDGTFGDLAALLK